MKNKTLFAVSAAILALAFTAGTMAFKRAEKDRVARIAEYSRPPLVRDHAPTLGEASAPVLIVEFIDPACETCWAFYPRVKEKMAANPGKIRLVLRFAPFHEGSDKVAAALAAAHRQGKFWPALEALMATQDDWAAHHTARVEKIWPHLGGLGLDLKKLKADMATPETAAWIAQDLEDAGALNVTKTPEFFVNGKGLPTFGFGPLIMLIDDALAGRD